MKITNYFEKRNLQILGILIIAAMMLLAGVTPVSAASSVECEYISGSNLDSNDYWRHAYTTKSYLIKDGSGYMRVQGFNGEGTVVAYYDSQFNVISRRTIPQELPLFGGFYASASNYFLVTGQNNLNENDSVEVYRITKYDRNWNRIGACGLKGANTYIPFDAGSCRMVMDGNYLIIRTCHEMYDRGDGLHHQANVTIEVNTSSMTVTDSYYDVMDTSHGYVSHSFNQFIGLDSHKIVAVDHGDAYPRSICLMRYPTDVTTGKFQSGSVSTTTILPIPGTIGNNDTGATVGAFEMIGSSYLVAGSSVVQDSSNTSRETRNVFVYSSGGGRIWLTSYAEGSETATNPHMVKINSNSFMVLWTRGEDIYYTLIDKNGTRQGNIYSVAGHLSDCAPIYDNGNVIWYTADDGMEAFYRISVNNPSQPEVIHRTYGHDYQCVSAQNGLATVKCSKCGDVKTAEVPVSVSAYWRTSSSENEYYSGSSMVHVPFGDTVAYMTSIDYRDGYDSSGMVLSDLEFTCNDASSFKVDMENRQMSFSKPGKYTITVGAKYDPSVKKESTFYVFTPLKSVKLQALSAEGKKAGEEIIIAAVPEGGGYIRYDFEVKTPSGEVLTHSQYDSKGIAFTAKEAGAYVIKVTATNYSSADNEAVTSDSLTYVVSPAETGANSGAGTTGSASASESGSTATAGKGSASAAVGTSHTVYAEKNTMPKNCWSFAA